MHRRAFAGLVAVVFAATGTGTAIATGDASAPSRVTISTPESTSFEINRFAQEGLRWNRDVYVIRSGGTLTFKNLQSDEPHTFSIVKKSQLPLTRRRIERCSAEPPALPKNRACRALVKAHAPNSQGNPQNPLVNKGKAGIDRPGDSVFIPPKGSPQPTITVSAAPGATLHFLCLVHPWMQATLEVR